MEVSDRKREANAENAKKATGPRTDAGKNRSRYNAEKHGLFSREIRFPDERSRADFEALQSEMRADYQPQGPLENHLVDQITSDIWKTRIVAALEMRALSAQWEYGNSAAAVLSDARQCVESAMAPQGAAGPFSELL